MITTLVLLARLAAIALTGWTFAELDLRKSDRELAETQDDLAVALGWHEKRTHDNAVVHTTLHVIEGGDR